MAAENDARPITSLRMAAISTNDDDSRGRAFVVRAVEVRHAPALLELLNKAEGEPLRWEIDAANTGKLRLLARVCTDVDIVLDAVVPMLLHDPVDARAATLLRRCTSSLLDSARKFDGPNGLLHALVRISSEPLLLHADHVDKRTRSAQWLRANVEEMARPIEEMKAMKAVLVRIGDGGGGGDGDGDGDGDLAQEKPTAITGLRHAAGLTVTRPYPGRYIITEVELRHAPALLQLVTNAPGWVLDRDHKIRNLSGLCNEVDVILFAVLPALDQNPRDATAARLLKRYSWRIMHISRHIDGPVGDFHKLASSTSSTLLRHGEYILKDMRSEKWLRDNAWGIRVSLEGFKNTAVLFQEFDAEDNLIIGGTGDDATSIE